MMVSNLQDSTPAPPLSYADRVKKLQRKDSPASGSTQQPQTRSQPSPSTSALPSAPKVAKPPAVEPSAKPQGAALVADCPVPSSPKSGRTPSSTKSSNDEGNLSTQDSTSSSTMKKAAVPPKVNVWAQRTEKMAKVLSQQVTGSTDTLTQPQKVGGAASRTSAAASSASQVSAVLPAALQEADTAAEEASSSGNVSSARVPGEDDAEAWVVRPHLAPAAVPLPPLDASSWPEVGKAPPEDVEPLGQGVSGEGELEGKTKKETQSSGTKRGEKPRWVPIPAEELRAAADAHRAAQSSHSRSQSQQRSQNRGAGSASGSTGRSTHGSLERSKAPASGSRDRPSAPQSEMHSRAGSIQSSPRHVPARLRRLPDDLGGPSSRKSSRTNSPRPYLSASIPAAGGTELLQGPVHLPEAMNGSGYYPGIPHPHVPSLYSVTPPYPPPPGAVPIAYNPAYPYAPYPYGTPPGQPYPMFWPAMPQDPRHPYAISSQSQSPATHPSSLTRSDSPPTSAGSSPAEERTEASVVPVNVGAPGAPSDAQNSAAESKPSNGRQRILSFGSIRADGEIVGEEGVAQAAEAAPSGVDTPGSLGLNVESLNISDNVDVTPRRAQRPAFKLNPETPAFSIGPARGDPGPLKRKPTAAAISNGFQTIGITASASGVTNGDEKVSNATTSETTWEFGTTRQVPDAQEAPSTSEAVAQPEVTTSEGAANTSDLAAPDTIPLRLRLSPLGVNAEGLPPTPIPPSAGPALYANNNPLSFDPSTKEDEWRVRDFGYGFGRPRPDGTYAPREDRPPKDRSYYGGRSAPRSYDPEVFRRGFGGRRARGGSRGYGRGGRYRGSFPRYPPRDAEFNVEEGYAFGVPDAGVYFVPPPVAPPGYMPPAYDPAFVYPAGYPLAPVPSVAQPAAPVPTPQTKLSFPLDPTRYYLLGQLEYYLSEDNMAQDFYLRKQMDSQGWIPSHLFALFPRVRTLTHDLQLVKDVLTLSSLVEVKSDFVRSYKWRRFVLPDAKASVIDGGTTLPADTVSTTQVDVEQMLLLNPPSKVAADATGATVSAQPASPVVGKHLHVHAGASHVHDSDYDYAAEEYEDDEDEDDDEDDVVFVLGKDADRSWTPEHKVES